MRHIHVFSFFFLSIILLVGCGSTAVTQEAFDEHKREAFALLVARETPATEILVADGTTVDIEKWDRTTSEWQHVASDHKGTYKPEKAQLPGFFRYRTGKEWHYVYLRPEPPQPEPVTEPEPQVLTLWETQLGRPWSVSRWLSASAVFEVQWSPLDAVTWSASFEAQQRFRPTGAAKYRWRVKGASDRDWVVEEYHVSVDVILYNATFAWYQSRNQQHPPVTQPPPDPDVVPVGPASTEAAGLVNRN